MAGLTEPGVRALQEEYKEAQQGLVDLAEALLEARHRVDLLEQEKKDLEVQLLIAGQ